jgi:hypothetical protein
LFGIISQIVYTYQTGAKSCSAFGIIHLPLNQTHCNIDIAAQQQQWMLPINKSKYIFMLIADVSPQATAMSTGGNNGCGWTPGCAA